MSVNVRSKQRPHALTTRGRRIFHSVFAVLFAAAIVLSSFAVSWARQDAALGVAFAAAPACPPGTVPAGNCVGWEQETVSSVELGRGLVSVHLSPGGQTLPFARNDAWPATLTSGVSVPVLVWRNQAQALRDPTGKVFYSDDAPGHSRYDDIATALCPFGFVLGMYIAFGSLDVPPLRVRRPRLWSALNVIGAAAAAGLFVAGATIQDADSVVPGIISGLIVFVLGALAIAGIAEVVRRYRLQREDEVAR